MDDAEFWLKQRAIEKRRENLAALIAGGHPDIIVDSSARRLLKAYESMHGRWWPHSAPPTRFRNWIEWHLNDRRCECGGFIWPWQKRAYDDECGWIHRKCGDEDEATA